MTQIVPCRTELSDRFPVASFAIRVPPERYFEVAFATDPRLLHPESSAQRTPRNFYTSRTSGLMRAPAGEATYLLPSDQLRRFAGGRRLYFALATYGSRRGDDVHTSADVEHLEQLPFVRLATSFSGRSLERARLMGAVPSPAESYGGKSPTLTWGGDLGVSEAGASDDYSDGYDPSLWGKAGEARVPQATDSERGHAPASSPESSTVYRQESEPAVGASDAVTEVSEVHPETYGSVGTAVTALGDEDEEIPGVADTREDGDVEDEAQALADDSDLYRTDADLEYQTRGMPGAETLGDQDASYLDDGEAYGTGEGSWDAALDAGPGEIEDEASGQDLPDIEESATSLDAGAEIAYEDDDEDQNEDELANAAEVSDWDAGLGDSDDEEEEPVQDDYEFDEGYAGVMPDESTAFLPEGSDPHPGLTAEVAPARPPITADPAGAYPLDPVAKAQLLYAVSDLHGNEHPFAAWSRAGDGGLRFGVADFDQGTGTLGSLLGRCRDEDPEAFASYYGDAWQELLDITNAAGEEERLAPVAGAELSAPEWTERFVQAASHRPFQRAQLKEAAARCIDPNLGAAARLGLHRDRALAALIDRAQRLGNEAAVAEAADMLCPVKRADLRGGNTGRLDETLGLLGYGNGSLRKRLEEFQADMGVDEAGRFGAETQTALVQTLHDRGQLDDDPASAVGALTAYGGQDRLLDPESPYLSDRDYALAEFA